MKTRELTTVVLTRDIPEHGLREGDVGAVVHAYKNNAAFEVEFLTSDGQTLCVLTLRPDDVREMKPREILHVREVS